MPDITVDDFRTFGKNLMEDKDYFHIDEVRDLRLSVASVMPILNIGHFDDLITSMQEEDSSIQQDQPESDEQQLVDPMSLDNETLVENFSDQEQRLVCLGKYDEELKIHKT